MSTSDKINKKRTRLKGRVSLSQKSEPGFILVPAVVVRSAAYARLSAYARAVLGEITTQYRPADLGNNGSLWVIPPLLADSKSGAKRQAPVSASA